MENINLNYELNSKSKKSIYALTVISQVLLLFVSLISLILWIPIFFFSKEIAASVFIFGICSFIFSLLLLWLSNSLDGSLDVETSFFKNNNIIWDNNSQSYFMGKNIISNDELNQMKKNYLMKIRAKKRINKVK